MLSIEVAWIGFWFALPTLQAVAYYHSYVIHNNLKDALIFPEIYSKY